MKQGNKNDMLEYWIKKVGTHTSKLNTALNLQTCRCGISNQSHNIMYS